MSQPKMPTMVDALIPVISLILMLALSVYLFGSDSSSGPNQIVLTLGAAIAAIVAMRNGHTWPELLKAIVAGISTAMGAILILLSVGGLIGTWLMAGTVPSLIYYGLELLSPQWFYAASLLICAIAALATGSSWTVAGTLGVALVGVALGLGLSPAITAGAIVSGAYFGDKMSPLSDTTNLAPAVVETDLFTHIRHMAWTTGPSIIMALITFSVIGLMADVPAENTALQDLMTTLDSAFNITPLALIPLAVVFYMAYKKVPPLPTILFGALLGGFVAIVMQPQVVLDFAASPDLPVGLALTKGVWLALSDGYVSTTGVTEVDDLLSRGGMSGMLVTIWLILTALSYGAVLEHARMLERLIESALRAAKSTGSLIMTVVFSCIGINIIAADQYIAIVLPGKMFKAEFERRNLDPVNLSRVVEDSGTLTSPLVPWNTCGAYMAATLGVATLAYLPFAFFNLINPLVSIIYGYTGFTITRLDGEPDTASA
ncbi:Na+/H+ antiporter NhaC [Woeseia oceani]|uniref:Na+/H+ antiporter NhaC n=1 Tax=Woeseia oceani TaxID=1548547 RepID=A0A193LJ71_9GAMM|nr:Na+/H+ antiporter NhaC [Woeseia oceani]ANO52444.1 Na+/H+ antiporter NhaC [Woeseia oceani]